MFARRKKNPEYVRNVRGLEKTENSAMHTIQNQIDKYLILPI